MNGIKEIVNDGIKTKEDNHFFTIGNKIYYGNKKLTIISLLISYLIAFIIKILILSTIIYFSVGYFKPISFWISILIAIVIYFIIPTKSNSNTEEE